MEKSILFVEDEYYTLRTIGTELRNKGHTVHIATDAGEAIELLSSKEYDLIVLDIMIPSEDEVINESKHFERYVGLLLCKKIREQLHLTTPIVVLSVVGTLAVKKELEKLDISEYIVKPALFEDILDCINKYL